MRFCKKNIHIINFFLSLHYGEGTKCQSRIRSTKRGFVKKNAGGFRYKPRGDWFSFGKVRKHCFLSSCKQTLFLARRACAAPAVRPISSTRRQSLLNARTTVGESYTTVYCLKKQKFLQKFIDLLQEAFIHVRHILIWMDALYVTTFGLLNKNTHPCHYRLKLGRARTILNITSVGFVWEKKVIYT